MLKNFIVIMILSVSFLWGEAVKDENYRDVASSGAWCWFQDPRAVWVPGTEKVLTGYVDESGSIKISVFDFSNGRVEECLIKENLQRDDHAAPSFLVSSEDKTMIFYTAHNGENMFYRINEDPDDLSKWGEEKSLPVNIKGKLGYCYPNPVRLSHEDGRIYLFWRGGTFKPTFSWTDDEGKNWREAKVLVRTDDSYKRPYVKVYSNGDKRVHFAFTDGHPRDVALNNIYYMYYEGGAFYRADGSEISTLDDLPVQHQRADLVYDAAKTNARAWIWDVSVDEEGRPVLVFTWLKEETKHVYYYAKWTGENWKVNRITEGGQAFPRLELKKEERDPEPHYSGGIYLNHDDPSVVYLSKPLNDRYEIIRYETGDDGENWLKEAVTKDSYFDNVRPLYVKNPEKKEMILWMNGPYEHYTKYQTSIKANCVYDSISPLLKKKEIMNVMDRAARWQMENPGRRHTRDWTQGALYKGVYCFAALSEDKSFMNYLRDVCEKNQWKLGDRKYHADDHCVGQTYIDFYREEKNEKMIARVVDRFDWILENQPRTDLTMGTSGCQKRWNWCDAIFMSPTVWAMLYETTGEEKYFNYLKKELNATTEYLYDTEERLYFRDSKYFQRRERNGEKVFWGRGNGWVMGGLAQIIESTKDKKEFNRKYIEIFRDMADKIASLQDENGYWHASLLDPESFPAPETSCTGFFCYSLAWGINNGYLEKEKYFPVVKKSWEALVKAVHPNGKLGFVQQIGEDPRKTNYQQTEVYGVGAFLLAGSEMLKLAE